MLHDHFTSNYKAILMPTQMSRYAPMGNFYGSMYPLQKCASWPKYALGKLWPLHGNYIKFWRQFWCAKFLIALVVKKKPNYRRKLLHVLTKETSTMTYLMCTYKYLKLVYMIKTKVLIVSFTKSDAWHMDVSFIRTPNNELYSPPKCGNSPKSWLLILLLCNGLCDLQQPSLSA